jgi:alkylation response protein AidB-like acyl-CoA dehydrogenase
MHFAFTDQQLEFRDAVRQLLTKECTADDLRSAFAAPAARTPRWMALADMGVVGLEAPDAAGGLGLGLVDLVPVLEEAGRVALPEPLVETTALASPLLAYLAGVDPADARLPAWLTALAAGELAVAVGSATPGLAIAGADGADLLILCTEEGDPAPEIHIVVPGDATVTPVASLDPTRRLGTVHVDRSPGTVFATGDVARSAIHVTAERAAVATGAVLLGLADRMIVLAAEYAKVRQQFGKPIGSFQAVKHLLAGAQVKLEFARPVVYGAAWSLDEGEAGASRSVSVAKAFASDAATEAARVSLQVHGAIGYTWECDLHLYLKRAWALAEAWGSAGEHRQRLLDSLVADA